MKTVELFAGIGGFRLAADSCGFETVWANDQCAKACNVYRTQFGAAELHQGDIWTLKDEIPPHHLLTAGFPCQPFSAAGKKQGIVDPRGTLFQAIVDVLRRKQPAFFILENVKRLLTMDRGRHFATILACLAELDYDIEWRLLNAMHFGLPQNRQRVFILGTRRSEPQSVGQRSDDPPPIRLATTDDLRTFRRQDLDSIRTLDGWRSIDAHGRSFPNWGLAKRGRFYGVDLQEFSEALAPVRLRSVLESDVAASFDFTESTLERVKKNTMVEKFVQGVEILSNQLGGARMGYTIFGIDGIAPTLTSTASRHYERYKIGDCYRRLTNVEYARIQGFPDDHCAVAPVYDQYALVGNAVPPPMVEWVMDKLASQGVRRDEIRLKDRQRELFEHAG
ncbi:MAG TPA: DNA cytosine methyltransferase [Pirellulales bacterium]|nr:DNA cytosine methyltransferase [Pirellulales bacterium]